MDTYIAGASGSTWLAFLGPSLGAIFAILGVGWTNRSNRLRQQEQLEHDTIERENERKSALHKEIGIETAKALSLVLKGIQNVNSCETKEELANAIDVSSINEAVNKIYLIGNESVLKMAKETGNSVNDGLQKLMTIKIEQLLISDQIKDNKQNIDRIQQDIANAHNDLNRVNPAIDRPLFEKIKEFISKSYRDSADLYGKNSKLYQKTSQLYIDMTNATWVVMSEYQKNALKLIIALRIQLGIPTDQEFMEKELLNAIDPSKMKKFSDDLFERLLK